MPNNEINKTATMEENLEWFKTNSSKLITVYPRMWIVISNKEVIKVGDYQEMKKFRDSYSKLDINCINVHCMDFNLFNSADIEKSNCFISARL